MRLLRTNAFLNIFLKSRFTPGKEQYLLKPNATKETAMKIVLILRACIAGSHLLSYGCRCGFVFYKQVSCRDCDWYLSFIYQCCDIVLQLLR